MEYALKTGNKRRIGTCYVNLGAIQTRLVQMRAEGIATLLKAIPILEEVNDRRLLCDAYNYLVNAYRMDGNLNQAMYYLQNLISWHMKCKLMRNGSDIIRRRRVYCKRVKSIQKPLFIIGE